MIERSLPAGAEFLGRYGVNIPQLRGSLQEVAAAATQLIATRALTVGQNALWVALLFGLTLYLLFFFFRDGKRIVAGVARVLPLGVDRRERLPGKFAQVAHATVKGSLILAVAQGGLGAILFDCGHPGRRVLGRDHGGPFVVTRRRREPRVATRSAFPGYLGIIRRRVHRIDNSRRYP
jgi:hypothetical protein